MKILFCNPDEKGLNFEDPGFFKILHKKLRKTRHIMEVKEYRENRSDQQNRYMWGCVYKMMSEETGYTKKEIHELMGREFLDYERMGKWFIRSTTDLNTKEMEDYLESVRRWASLPDNLGLYIPLPNEKENFYYEMQ